MVISGNDVVDIIPVLSACQTNKGGGTTGATYTDKSAVSGVKYTYTVRGISGGKLGRYNSTGLSCYRLTTPKITGVGNTGTGLKVTWGKVSGASGYYVYRKISGGSWKRIAGTTAITYTDKTAAAGTGYIYTVRAIKGGKLSSYNSKGLSCYRLTTPKLTKLENINEGLKLSWEKVRGAGSYNVYRKTSGGSWNKIASTTSVAYTDKTAGFGIPYSYTVRAVKGSSVSYYNKSGLTKSRTSSLSITKISNDNGGIDIAWNAVENAEYYEIYKKEEGGSYQLLAKVSKNTLKRNDSYVYNGKKYSYIIKAYKGNMYSSGTLLAASSAKTIMYVSSPWVISISAYHEQTVIKWKPVDGAERYDVYHSYSYGAWEKIGTTTGTSFAYSKSNPTEKDDYAVVTILKGNRSDYTSHSVEKLWDEYVDVAGTRYYLGTPESKLGSDFAEKFYGNHGEVWYIYGAGFYTNFVALGVVDKCVVEIITAGSGFSYKGMSCGSAKISGIEKNGVEIATDENDSNIVHAVRLYDPEVISEYSYSTTAQALSGESKLIFHLTNAFRVYHGRSILSWCSIAAESARLHSQDMADNNYFAHESQDGRQPWDRMEALGINYVSAGENISAGKYSGFVAYDSWVNSLGHRENLLSSSYKSLGVGIAYNASSMYKMYHTQNFYSRWK